MDTIEELKKLTSLLNEGTITKEEFNKLKANLLSSIDNATTPIPPLKTIVDNYDKPIWVKGNPYRKGCGIIIVIIIVLSIIGGIIGSNSNNSSAESTSGSSSNKLNHTCCNCSGTGKVTTPDGEMQCPICYGCGKLTQAQWENHCQHN